MSDGELLSSELCALFEDDQREHAQAPQVNTEEYRSLRQRDRERRYRARQILAAVAQPEAEALYHAAWLFNHGEEADDALQAHTLALESSRRGHAPARWLTAAAYDRWCMYRGLPQKYGTQFVPDGKRFRLWDLDGNTSDEERARWDVPPLSEQLRRAAEWTTRSPQPPLDDAPNWLKKAIERWSLKRELE